MRVLDSGRLSRGGLIEEFEYEVCEHVGMQYGIAVSSGTAGLSLALHCLDLPRGKKVVVPSFTFAASASTIVHAGLVPKFVDIGPDMLMDHSCLGHALTDDVCAVMAVDLFGTVFSTSWIPSTIPVIEDACEAFGASLNGRKAGTFGRAGVFGFYPNKQVTTGEGGMVVTNDMVMAVAMTSLRNHGRNNCDHVMMPGWNYRMDEMSAAIGFEQILRIDMIVSMRRERAARYAQNLSDVPGIAPMQVGEGDSPFVVWALLSSQDVRDRLRRDLLDRNIDTAIYFQPLHREPAFARYADGELPVTDDIASRIICLPFWTHMPFKTIDYVTDTIKELLL